MKRLARLLTVPLCAVLGAVIPATAPSAVPLRWQVESSRLSPVAFDAVRGETLALEASFNSYGNPLSMAGKPCAIFYQTNGMGSAWWTSPATAVSNRVSATITPQMVPSMSPATASGSPATEPVAIKGFLGSTGDIYRAAFTIRFRPGPGATPNVIEQPPPILDLAHTVVINPPWPTQADFAATTTVMRAELKTYVEEQVEGAGSVSPSIVTNIAIDVTANKRDKTDMFAEWIADVEHSGESGTHVEIKWHETGWNIWYNDMWMGVSDQGDVNSTSLHWVNYDTIYHLDTTATRSRITTTSDLSSATNNLASIASLSSLSSTVSTVSSTAATLATQVSTIGAHLNAEDARFVSTNYNSATHMPEAYVEIKLTNNTWSTIWSEMTRFNWLTNTYLPTNYASRAALDEKADRAWGYYDSHTGSYAPDGYTWLSSPRIAIAAGLAYQRTVTSEGAVWVLESNGLVTQTGGETNGFFRITDEEGNTQFEIVKGNKRTIGADYSSCQVVAGFSPTKLQIGYSIASDTNPTIEVTGSLSSPSWKSETDADCLANVTWSGSSGAYVAQVQSKTAQPSLFVRATYQSGGETYINNAAPVALNHLYLGGVKYAVSTNTISGHLVLTLTPSL